MNDDNSVDEDLKVIRAAAGAAGDRNPFCIFSRTLEYNVTEQYRFQIKCVKHLM